MVMTCLSTSRIAAKTSRQSGMTMWFLAFEPGAAWIIRTLHLVDKMGVTKYPFDVTIATRKAGQSTSSNVAPMLTSRVYLNISKKATFLTPKSFFAVQQANTDVAEYGISTIFKHQRLC